MSKITIKKTIEFQVDLVPSFCNYWPEVSIEANGQELWRAFVEYPQTVKIEFSPAENNHLYIRYLNKRSGPDEWDTQLNSQGDIIADQNCVLTNFKIGGSRCDFLLRNLIYHHDDQTTEKGLWGFMAKKGHYLIEFPKEIYKWIVDSRTPFLMQTRSHNSSLEYWTNYLGDPNDPKTVELLKEIEILIDKMT